MEVTLAGKGNWLPGVSSNKKTGLFVFEIEIIYKFSSMKLLEYDLMLSLTFLKFSNISSLAPFVLAGSGKFW